MKFPVEKNLEVFSGENSIRDFLNPNNHSPTPLVELPKSLNPFLNSGVRIYAKCEYLRPLLNIKSLQVLGMLEDAQNSGKLSGVHTLVENTSGNTGFSLGIISKIFGIPNVELIVPYDIAPGKLEMLRLIGAQIEPCKTDGIEKAKEIGNQKGFFNLNQYWNEANPDAIEKWLAPQIWEQTQGKLTVFCSGLGTTGTILGVERFLEKKEAKTSIVGVKLAPDHAIPGVRTSKKLEEISFDWWSEIDYQIEVKTKESYKKSLELCRVGLIAGPSSGFVLAGLIKFLKSQCTQRNNKLDNFRNKNNEVVAVFICADTPFPYLDKYSTILDPSDF
ncbi:MAG: pyridoxal-phosphate dependent enzyme [Candidatus Staskawiczbacteria bacterium]|nr:pyridoxal-phosphate dependent enzyme [Candidatus Staskawiczbacteria bacterium]